MGEKNNEKVQKRNVFCNKCLREYSSRVKHPVCRKCWSSNVVEASSISDKMTLKVIEREINKRLDKIEDAVFDIIKVMDRIEERVEKQRDYMKSVGGEVERHHEKLYPKKKE